MKSNTMIEFENVTRSYGNKVAVKDLTLRVAGGELFAFLGPNGAGKTTSIKMIAGLLRPNRGCVRVCGYDVVKQTRQTNQRISYIPDEPYLYDKLTGREFLQFIAELYGLDGRAADNKIGQQIDYFDLADFLDDLAETFSHGMRQRLVFAAALLHDPEVLVVDEPMVGLDPRNIRLVKDMLRARVAAGAAVFMSTHTLAIAEEICDRIGIIDRGQLLFTGTLPELRQELYKQDTSLEQLFLELTDDDEPSRQTTRQPEDVA